MTRRSFIPSADYLIRENTKLVDDLRKEVDQLKKKLEAAGDLLKKTGKSSGAAKPKPKRKTPAQRRKELLRQQLALIEEVTMGQNLIEAVVEQYLLSSDGDTHTPITKKFRKVFTNSDAAAVPSPYLRPSSGFLEVRADGKYRHLGFFLGDDGADGSFAPWKVVQDDEGMWVLVPAEIVNAEEAKRSR